MKINSATFEFSKELKDDNIPLYVDIKLSIRETLNNIDDIKNLIDTINTGIEIDIVKRNEEKDG